MGIFTSTSNPPGNCEKKEREAITSIIDKEMTVTGDITFSGKARIDGNIEGNIKGEYLIISETATVTGDINAEIIVCQGKVDGNIQADQFFAKKPTRINGRLETRDLSVESGAMISGEIQAAVQKLSVLEGGSNESATASHTNNSAS
ncbi:polymer-forming cytoskeletal protein [Thermodesulfobacteriota bacterium]